MLSDICWHGHLRVLQGGGRLQVMQETPSLAGNRPSETAGVVTTTPPQEGSELQEQARRPWGLVWDHHPPTAPPLHSSLPKGRAVSLLLPHLCTP